MKERLCTNIVLLFLFYFVSKLCLQHFTFENDICCRSLLMCCAKLKTFHSTTSLIRDCVMNYYCSLYLLRLYVISPFIC